MNFALKILTPELLYSIHSFWKMILKRAESNIADQFDYRVVGFTRVEEGCITVLYKIQSGPTMSQYWINDGGRVFVQCRLKCDYPFTV